MSTDLFGQEVPDPRLSATDGVPDRSTNDIEEVVAVLRIAGGEGYVAFGARAQAVWRYSGADSVIEPVARHEADIVRQLVDAGWLTLGGGHGHGNERHGMGEGRRVLVPKRVREWLLRQENYKQLGQPVRVVGDG